MWSQATAVIIKPIPVDIIQNICSNQTHEQETWRHVVSLEMSDQNNVNANIRKQKYTKHSIVILYFPKGVIYLPITQ